MKEYPCELSDSGFCIYGGSKRFNYGFVCGSAGYCRKEKRFIYNMLFGKYISCPLKTAGEKCPVCENKEGDDGTLSKN